MDAKLTRAELERGVLEAMVASARAPMAWGTDDCALWCMNVLRGVLGYDPAERYRGRYRTRLGALRALGKGGLPAALRGVARRHGWRRVNEGGEQPGDIGMISVGGVVSTVICRAPGWYVGRNETGFTAVPARAVRVAWRVL